MKSIYIILTQSGTEVSKMLKMITREKYNHSSICIDNSFREFYSFGRKKINNPLIGGFIIENAFKHVFGKYENIPCTIIKKEISDEQYQTLRNIINEFIINKDKYSYAFIGLALADTNYSIINNSKFFCSQFVAKLLNDIQIATPKKPEHMHPMDFVNLADTQIVFEGDLKKFCSSLN